MRAGNRPISSATIDGWQPGTCWVTDPENAPLAHGYRGRVGIDDRYWEPIADAEADAVVGAGARVIARHRRWLFAVARCRTATGDV